VTIDDLVELHERTKAWCGEPWPANDRMAMRVVVETLRKEMVFWVTDCHACAQHEQMWNEILGSDAEVKAAGGSSVALSPSPAADVCIWDSYYAGYTWDTPYKTGCGNVTRVSTVDENCHFCRKPISFKEAP
jgi:hypothetical protein